MNSKRAFKLLKEIGFTRFGGSAEELEAAKILVRECESVGIKAEIEEFSVNSEAIANAELIADGVSYKVEGYGNSGNTPDEGLTAPFYYLENGEDVHKQRANGKIVLVNGYVGLVIYKKIVESGAVGFISFAGNVIDTERNSDLERKELRQPLKDIKILPGVNLRAVDAMRLVKQNPKEVTIKLKQEEFTVNSRNVVAKIPGEIDEAVVFTAHYDSVHFSKGVYDNGAGSVINMEVLKYFAANKPRRNLIFIWCGSEERGLLGSKAYCNAHKEELEKIKLCINVDVAAPVLGKELIMVTADESLKHAVEYMAKEVGYATNVTWDIYSSDSIPFADNGVPGINIARFGVPGTSHIHTRNDTMFFLSEPALKITADFVEQFAIRYVNSFTFPVPRTIPKEIKEKVDKYLGREVNKA
ncbi:MAG: M28 family metallopeptidase [Clostridia bacterium]|nr:M28 family metallopeptidase [Clostridia bacterium]